jgi:hypothetical protein
MMKKFKEKNWKIIQIFYIRNCNTVHLFLSLHVRLPRGTDNPAALQREHPELSNQT